MNDDFTREEALFREALGRHASDLDQVPVGFVPPQEQRRGAAPRWLAAAAAVVLVAGGSYAATQRTTNDPGPSAQSAVPRPTSASPSRTATASPSPTPTVTPTSPPSASRSSSAGTLPSSSAQSSTDRTPSSPPDRTPDPSTGPSAGPTSAPGTASPGRGGGSTLSPAAASLSGLPDPAPGGHWFSSGNVAVQLPSGWSWGVDDPTCTAVDDGPANEGPFARLGPAGKPSCPVKWTRSAPVAYLAVETPSEGSTTSPSVPRGAVGRIVGFTAVSVQMTDGSPLSSADRAVAERIVDSARTFRADTAGCSPTSPVGVRQQPRPKAWDITTAKVTAAGTCTYGPMADFVGSTVMTAAESDRLATLVRAIRSTPAGTSKGPATCDSVLSRRVVMHLLTDTGVHDLYVYDKDCTAYVDDGTTRRPISDSWFQWMQVMGG